MANDRNFAGPAAVSPSYELINPLDLYIDEEFQKAIKTVPYMSSLSWMKAIKGRSSKRKVRRHEYSYYEEGQFMKAAATIKSISANGGMFDIVLEADDHNDLGGVGKGSFPVERMSCIFADGQTTGYVNSVDRSSDGAHKVTVKKWNTNQDIASVALPGTPIVFVSNAQSERSTGTESRTPQFEKITNKMQILREAFDTSDVEAQNQLRFSTSSGKNYLWYKGIEDTAQRFEFQKEAACLLMPQAGGLTDKNGNPVNSTFGLIPQIDQHGISLEYFQTPDMSSFDELMLALDNNYADKEYIVGAGHNAMLKLKEFLVKFAQNGTGGISFSPFDGGEQQAIKLNFKYYSVGAYTFYFQQWDIFSHKDSLGAPGLPFRHKLVFIPAGMTRNADPDLPAGSSSYEPYIQLVTPQWGVQLGHNMTDNGDHVMWEMGAMAAPYGNSDVMEKKVHFYTAISLEMRCRHKFAQMDLA